MKYWAVLRLFKEYLQASNVTEGKVVLESCQLIRPVKNILAPETDSVIVSSLGSGFERFVDLNAVDIASVSSRARLSYLIKETRPEFLYKVGQSRDGSGE
jgi:hypothetical protein